jgi:hypothetical protein
VFPALYLLPGAMRPDPDLIAFGCFYLDAFSSREPVLTSLENALIERQDMLVERGVEVLNVEVVGDAYAIASNYLRKSGVIPDTFATNERLLGIIVKLFQRGELNRLRLANRAIAKFEAETLVVA